MGGESDRKQRVQQAQRASVLMAAAALFGRTGYEAATMADVARVAGVAVGTIYKFFPSKQALHLALLEYQANAILAHGLGEPAARAEEPALVAELYADVFGWADGGSERRGRAAQAKRAEILTAAAQVFQAEGFHGATMAGIAAAAGMATGTLYNFFASKQALFETLIGEKAGEFFAAVRAAVDLDDGREATAAAWIGRMVAAECTFYEANRDFLRLSVAARGGMEWAAREALGEAFRRQYAEHLAWVAGLLAAGMAAGELQPMDPAEMAQALVGMLNATLFEWTLAGGETGLAARAQRIVELFLDGARSA